MIGNSFLIQLTMFVLALSVFFSFIKPTYLSIGKIQDEIVAYEEELEKVSAVNQKLRDLSERAMSIPADNMLALNTFMPDQVDEVKVVADIYAMANEARVYARSVKYDGTEKEVTNRRGVVAEDKDVADATPVAHSIQVSVTGTYEQAKKFLALLEINNYPLEVHDLKIATTELGIISLEMKLVTYTHK